MSQMDMIFGKPDDTAVDPVCKMIVTKVNPPGGSTEYGGDKYYFCAPGCRQEFVEHPEQYS
jgi:YHS domain-containing protein